MTCLITGATGNVGARVAQRLIALGHKPRVFVRSAEKARALFGDRVEIAVGDLGQPQALPLTGVEALFLVSPEGPELPLRDGAVAAAAKAAGVRRVVKLSAYSAALSGSATSSALGAWHAQGEAAIRASGIAFTFVQPVGFMSNALAWAPAIKAEGVVRAPTGEGRIAMIHPDDIAAVASEALLSPAYEGQTLPLTGPEALTYAEMTQQIGSAMGKPLVFQSISDEQAHARLIQNGMPSPLADALVALWRSVREGKVAVVTDRVQHVLGRKALTFAHWARDNAAAFR